MSTAEAAAGLTADELMAAVQRLSPAQLSEFTRRFAEWHEQNGREGQEEAALIAATKARLPPADERRLKRLTAKSERGTLTSKELQAYHALAQQAERVNATRVEALAELVRRRGRPVRQVMEEIGWKGGEDGP